MRQILVLVAATLWLVSGANADNGVLEINQACARNAGCFAGDPAGLPVQIAAAGSYRLTSNLVVSSQNQNGIVVSAPNVSIDLNGFAIFRSGCEVSCAMIQGGGFGIQPSPSTLEGISVKNGSAIGMGAAGIWTGPRGEVRNVRVRLNGFRGVDAGPNSAVSGNVSYQNNSHGIFAGSGSTVTNNTAYDNGGSGIASSDGVTLSGNTAYQNQEYGISTTVGSTVSGNTVRANIAGGLSLGSSSGYTGNVITGSPETVDGGVEIGINLCDSDTMCP